MRHRWRLHLLVAATICAAAPGQSGSQQKLYSQTLVPDRLIFQWRVDYDTQAIHALVTYQALEEKPNDWVAVGFSDRGELTNADLCVFWVDWKGNPYIQDASTQENSTRLALDDIQDCTDTGVTAPVGKSLTWSFSRKFSSGNPQDYIIEDGTTHLLWSFGRGPLFSLSGLDIADEGNSEHGFKRLRLLQVDPKIIPPDDTKTFDIRHQVPLPSDDTTYWCSTHKLPVPLKRKHHVIQYEPVITPGNEHVVHHMEVFHCTSDNVDEEFPLWSGPCGSDEAPDKLVQCKKVLAAWAIGAGPFTYPKEAGLKFGGQDFNQFVMLEVHYNNQNLEQGLKDDSGMKFYLTENLRPYDAGIMELGLVYTDRMAIPPQQEKFPLSGHCLPECTAVGFPPEGITIFGSQLHTHGAGVQVETKHFRNGDQLPELNRDNHYSTHFQEIRLLHQPRLILPGDELVTTCWYNTTGRENVTVGGFSFADEMCLNYVHYYPRTKALEICKSAVDQDDLNQYFSDLKGLENQAISDPGGCATHNYHAVEWTPKRALDLKHFYSSSRLSMQCQSGQGGPLPGKWTGMKHDPNVGKVAVSDYHVNLPSKTIENMRPKEHNQAHLIYALTPAGAKRKRIGKPMNEMRKRIGKPMNEMRKRSVKDRFARLIQLLNARKRSSPPEVVTPLEAEESEPADNEYEDYEMTTRDYSAEWSEYDTWGYDGIMKKKKRNPQVNNHLEKVMEVVKRGLGSFLS